MFTNSSTRLAIAICMFWGAHATVYAQDKHSGTRGELLYATHCSACHSEQIHWRDKRLVSDWNSLVSEVGRWQANIGLVWSTDEIADTARYLNAAFYHF
jgi:mono/diheme cytochrome c family protein